jgi:hypothetical protein
MRCQRRPREGWGVSRETDALSPKADGGKVKGEGRAQKKWKKDGKEKKGRSDREKGVGS